MPFFRRIAAGKMREGCASPSIGQRSVVMKDREKEDRSPYQESPTIQLKWEISAFLPDIDLKNDNPYLIESFRPSTLADADPAFFQDYWSVPERLLDLAWLFDCATPSQAPQEGWEQSSLFDDLPQENAAGSEVMSDVMLLEYNFQQIVGVFLRTIQYSQTSLKKLSNMPSDVEETSWMATCQRILHLSDNGDHPPSQLPALEQDLQELNHIAETLPQRYLGESRAADLYSTARAFPKERPETSSFSSDSNDERDEQILNLCHKLLSFFGDHSWRTDNQAYKRLSNIRQALLLLHRFFAADDSTPSPLKRTVITDSTFSKELWNSIQYTADQTCSYINSSLRNVSAREFTARVRIVMNTIQNLTKQLTLLPTVKKKLDIYLTDQKRCIAMLQRANGKRLIAFSGYFDCTDRNLCRHLSPSAPVPNLVLIHAFEFICRRWGAQLVSFTPALTLHIYRYYLDHTLSFQKRGPLHSDMYNTQKFPAVRKDYSCCERKILAHMEVHHTPVFGPLHLIVKFQPCMHCYAALSQWKPSFPGRCKSLPTGKRLFLSGQTPLTQRKPSVPGFTLELDYPDLDPRPYAPASGRPRRGTRYRTP